jgi:hypothetical protein
VSRRPSAPELAAAASRQAPGADHGTDTDAAGAGVVSEQRLYQLVRQTGEIRDQTFEIEFLDPGAQVLAFTLG